ncbi:hypothetical protein FRAAL1546 [Frankia alni ACN14a]|uniref:Uncharacterized protein n=1 Tax=Frankia alni (strain DSM 45986 / CECT 9034 / ACN14a) TaxID=326424 RepID=Q0RQH2_FRAAA|nr:hypothetical protein FRAAL1546 [Frankia alni ACN14a]
MSLASRVGPEGATRPPVTDPAGGYHDRFPDAPHPWFDTSRGASLASVFLWACECRYLSAECGLDCSSPL